MPELEITNLGVSLSGQQILDQLSVSVEKGEIISILGPSGCGKTTLLRTIAGFQSHESGEIKLQSRRLSGAGEFIPVEQRKLGMVFQDFALFPHLSVRQNICFGIQNRPESEQQQKLEELSNLLDMKAFIDQHPHQLSGGQQQRVAIARAMAAEPELLLLDEPFSNMDVELREQLARELRLVLNEANMTVIMVSHNHLEAFAMADKIGIMRSGKLLQFDNAYNLYHQPANEFIAEFVGEGVLINAESLGQGKIDCGLGQLQLGQQEQWPVGVKLKLLIRPDDVIHDDQSAHKAMVVERIFRGAEFLYSLELETGETISCLVPSHHNHPVNSPIGIRCEIEHLVIFPV